MFPKGRVMRLIYAGIAFACASLGFADTITLKNGSVVSGTYLGGTARTLRVDDGSNVQTLDVSDVVRIEFGGGAPAAHYERPVDRNDRPADRSDRPVLRRSEGNVMRPEDTPAPAPPPAPANFTLPAGTNLTIRMIEAVDS